MKPYRHTKLSAKVFDSEPEDWLENITDTDWVKPKKSELEKKVEKQTDKEAEKKVEEEVENDYLFTEGGGGCFHECDFTIYD